MEKADLSEEASYSLWVDSNEEDALSTPSNYSSCGSELERYCSANSVLGTASSVCSSVGNHSEILDNIRSLGLADDLEFFGGRQKLRCRSFGRKRNPVDLGRLDWLSDGMVDSPRENGSPGIPVFSRTADASHMMETGFNCIAAGNDIEGGGIVDAENENRKMPRPFPEKNTDVEDGCADIEAGSSVVSSSACEDRGSSDVCTRGSTSEFHARIGPLRLNDDDDAVRCGYSDYDCSAVDSGTDDEAGVHLLKGEVLHKLKANVGGNPLLMNKEVAFGDGDWDDYMQENGEAGLASNPLFGFESYEQTQKHLSLDGTYEDPYLQEALCLMDTQENGYLDDNRVCQSSLHQDYDRHDDVKSHPIQDPPDVDNQRGLVQNTSTKISSTENVATARCDQNPIDDFHDEKLPLLENGKHAGFRGAIQDGNFPSPVGDFTSEEVTQVDKKQVRNGETDKTPVPRMLANVDDKNLVSDETNGHDGRELFEEMVLDMEEILLDSGESRQGRYAQAMYMSQHFHCRDGSSTASNSDNNETHAFYQPPFMIEGLEVVGARQKKGDVSFGERLVGVKEFTLYRLRVWNGKDQWEVERRYREFFSLYQQLKVLFKNHDLILPPPWFKVERESRNFFGNISTDVVNERSSLIQDCLSSMLTAKTPFGVPSSLVLFLTPSKDDYPGLLNNSLPTLPQSLQRLGDDVKSSSSPRSHSQEVPTLGKKIYLEVELKVHKSTRQHLEEQRYMCAGCHKHLDSGRSLMQEFVKTIGLCKPRLCEYTCQLFCSSCHSGDTAVLPAKVLHNWDFSLYPISQLAKAYLESIYDKPMLCVSAVNPFLFSKVPALHHIMGIRRKIGAMVPFIRCPFKRSIQRGLGSRRYLLESNDFFALRDLVDLAKGPFAALPTIVDAASSKILEHLTQQCLICYEIGAPCAAKQACRDPASAILPFQEMEAVRCSLCSAIFHEPCIQYLRGCPCSKPESNTINMKMVPSKSSAFEFPNSFTLQKTDSIASSATGFFHDLLSKATPEMLWKRKNSSPVILMGSLPSTSS